MFPTKTRFPTRIDEESAFLRAVFADAHDFLFKVKVGTGQASSANPKRPSFVAYQSTRTRRQKSPDPHTLLLTIIMRTVFVALALAGGASAFIAPMTNVRATAPR